MKISYLQYQSIHENTFKPPGALFDYTILSCVDIRLVLPLLLLWLLSQHLS